MCAVQIQAMKIFTPSIVALAVSIFSSVALDAGQYRKIGEAGGVKPAEKPASPSIFNAPSSSRQKQTIPEEKTFIASRIGTEGAAEKSEKLDALYQLVRERYWLRKDGLLVVKASEGAQDLRPDRIIKKFTDTHYLIEERYYKSITPYDYGYRKWLVETSEQQPWIDGDDKAEPVFAEEDGIDQLTLPGGGMEYVRRMREVQKYNNTWVRISREKFGELLKGGAVFRVIESERQAPGQPPKLSRWMVRQNPRKMPAGTAG